MHKFSEIASPLIELTKMDKLQWSFEVEVGVNDRVIDFDSRKPFKVGILYMIRR